MEGNRRGVPLYEFLRTHFADISRSGLPADAGLEIFNGDRLPTIKELLSILAIGEANLFIPAHGQQFILQATDQKTKKIGDELSVKEHLFPDHPFAGLTADQIEVFQELIRFDRERNERQKKITPFPGAWESEKADDGDDDLNR